MYVKEGCLWGIKREKGKPDVHVNYGRCDFAEIKYGQIAVRTLYTNWQIKK